MAKKKYYAVAAGRRCGIFRDWASAKQQVDGYSGARYKSFASEAEAEAWLADPSANSTTPGKKGTAKSPPSPESPEGTVRVYTDGGSINNPGPGGYGIIIEDDNGCREMNGGFRRTTNNRMEMTAAIVALEKLATCRQPIQLFSDSSYLVNGINKGWAKSWRRRGWMKSDGNPALNSDLWERLLQLTGSLDVTFHWVKGHAGHSHNERCDRLARMAARQSGLPADTNYEAEAGQQV